MCTYILVLRSTRSGHRALGSGELILQNERKLRRSAGSGFAHRGPSVVRGAMLARPARRATYHRALRSGKLIPQNELRRSEGSGMLIGDPLGEGSNASSTHNAQKGAACS